jgi:peroxiredoxin
MAATPSAMLALGTTAPAFSLLDTVSGRTVSLSDFSGSPALLVMFICNHCPYVQAVIDRIESDMQALRGIGIGAVAISSNDVPAYPQDGFDQMEHSASRHGLSFPYLYDESQDVARAYGAACTPDFFGFDARGRLVYRGGLDASGRQFAAPGTRRELLEAMKAVAEGRCGLARGSRTMRSRLPAGGSGASPGDRRHSP